MARGVTRAESVMERMEVMMGDDVMAESARVDWDRGGLAPWTYHSEELTELERDVLFRRHWQLACHVSDVAEPGDYVAFDMVGERALILRGGDGRVRAFHNLCRHRGSRVVAGSRGRCDRMITCPFHGWRYNLDGTLRGPAFPDSLPRLDRVEHGLKPVEMEIWMGFVFVRFLPGDQPPVSQVLARHAAEVAPYATEAMVPADGEFWTQELAVNWKAVRDVDNEGYHVPVAHPALHDLYGANYYDEPLVEGTARSFGEMTERPGRLWSVRHYKAILPERTGLPVPNRRAWLYVGLFPNAVIAFYPDSTLFYQEYPLGARRTIQRGATYRYREESRALRLSRYLSGRIDRVTGREDTQLIQWTWEAMESSAFDGIVLSDREYLVRSYHDALRARVPVMNLERAPAGGALADTNARMLLSLVHTPVSAAPAPKAGKAGVASR